MSSLFDLLPGVRPLGCDMSLTGSALATADGVEVLKNKLTGPARLDFIEQAVWRRYCNEDCTHIFIEGLAIQSQTGKHLERAGLWYILQVGAWRRGIPFIAVAPGTLKKYATGNGSAKKPEMVAAARERFGYAGFDDNEADAILLHNIGLEVLGCPKVRVPKAHLATIGKVVLP